MKKFKLKTDVKFKLTIVVISILIFMGILSYQFTSSNFYIISGIIGVLLLIAIIISIIGFVKSVKEFKKPRSVKRMIYKVIVAITLCILFYLIIANTINAIQYIT